MNEQRMIEKAKANLMRHAGVKATDPELAAWMEGHAADCYVLDPDANGVNFDSPGSVYRLRPDYEPKKWWFAPSTKTVIDKPSDFAWRNHEDWLEVTAEYAAYLRDKPEGDWELRRVVVGDNYFDIYGRELFRRTGVDDIGPEDRGYRWCKPRVDMDELRKAVADTLAAVNAADRAHTMAYQRYTDALKGGAE
jgi:hypothetical protein